MAEKDFNTQLPVFGNGVEHKHIGSVVQNDVGANTFVIRLLDRYGNPFDMSDVNYVTFTVLRPDGKIEVDSGFHKVFEGLVSDEDVSGVSPAPQISFDGEASTVTITPSSGAISVPGECLATLELYDNDKRRVTTARVCFTVVSDLSMGYDFELDSHYPVLTNLIYECQIILEAKEEYGAAKETVEALKEEAKQYAESAKGSEENVRELIDNIGGIVGGVTDYNELENRPRLNGTELVGDVSLADIGLNEITKDDIDEIFEAAVPIEPIEMRAITIEELDEMFDEVFN